MNGNKDASSEQHTAHLGQRDTASSELFNT